MKITQKDIYKHYLYHIFDHQFIDRKQEKTLVVLHGFMENYDDFQFLSETFENYNILLINLPGHGETKLNHFYSIHDLKEKLFDFLMFQTNDLYLFAYSMGGRMASLLTHLSNLKAIILVSSGLGLQNEEEKKQRLKSDHDLFNRFNNPAEFFQYWYGQILFGNYQSLSIYQNNLSKKLTLNLDTINQSLDLLSPGVFPNIAEMKEALIKFSGLKFYIYGSLDLKYSLLKNDYEQIGFTTVAIEDAYHNLHKTHETQLIKKLKSII